MATPDPFNEGTGRSILWVLAFAGFALALLYMLGCAVRVDAGASIGARDPAPAVTPAPADLAALVDVYRQQLDAACRGGALPLDDCDRHRAALVDVLQADRQPSRVQAVRDVVRRADQIPDPVTRNALAAVARALRALVGG